jgi:two-component system cell cycle response regulator
MSFPEQRVSVTEDGVLRQRITKRVFWDLAIWMGGFGVLTGLTFPIAIALVLPQGKAVLDPRFFTLSVLAGVIVGAVNFLLAHRVVGARLKRLASSMTGVTRSLEHAQMTGDWSGCSSDLCALDVDSADEFGESAKAFNALVLALEEAHSFENLIYSLSSRLAKYLDLEELAAATLSFLSSEIGAAASALFVVRDGSTELVKGQNIHVSALDNLEFIESAVESSAIKILDLPREVVVVTSLLSFRPVSVVVVPVHVGGRALGAMIFACNSRLSFRHTRLLESLQPAISVTLNNAISHERFQRLAAVDPLTGTYNRRFGMGRLGEEFSRTVRDKAPLGLIAFDIDFFKKVNDTHGHLFGDRVLKAVSDAVRKNLREGDVLVRVGGEEFLIIAPGAGDGDVEALAERIRMNVETQKIRYGDTEINVTISLGGLSFGGYGADTPEELLESVDRALYLSKETGRNKVSMVHAPKSSFI